MKRQIVLALGLLVLLAGLVFAQKGISVKLIQANSSPGVQTTIVETSSQGKVYTDTLNLPDTVYAGMPFTGSVEGTEKFWWVEIEGKRDSAVGGFIQAVPVQTTYGPLYVNFLGRNGKWIGNTNIFVAPPPDSFSNNFPNIGQVGENIIFQNTHIGGIADSILCKIAGVNQKVITVIPGKAVVRLGYNWPVGRQPYEFDYGTSWDTSGVMTIIRANILGPDVIVSGQVDSFSLITEVGDIDLKDMHLIATITASGSVSLFGGNNRIFPITDKVTRFAALAKEPGWYEIRAIYSQVPFKQ